MLCVPASKAQVAKYRLLPGDVLVQQHQQSRVGGQDEPSSTGMEPVVFSNHFLRLRVDRGKLDPCYLARWFTHQWNRRVFQGLCTQWVNQAAVRKDDLLALKVPLPPLPEQQRIAAILARADRLRRLRRYALELSEGYLQAVFVEMFGDPVRNPKEWKWAKFEDAREGSDGEHVTPQRTQTRHQAPMSARNIQNGFIDFTTGRMHPRSTSTSRIRDDVVSEQAISCMSCSRYSWSSQP